MARVWRLLIVLLAACGDGATSGLDAWTGVPGDASDRDAFEADVAPGDAGDAVGNASDAAERDGVDVDASDADDASDVDDARDADDASDAVDGDDGVDGDDASDPVRCVRGRVLRETRGPNAALTGLGAVEVVPAEGVGVTIRQGADLATAPRTASASDGTFELCGTVASSPTDGPRLGAGPLEVVFEAATRAPDGRVLIAVVDGLDVDVPAQRGVPVVARRLWTWSLPLEGGDDLGEVILREADGAGALAILDQTRQVIAFASALFGAPGMEDRAIAPPTLGLVWSPARTPSCLSCYLPAAWGPLVLDAEAVTFDRALFLSGTASTPHHFTPSLVAHELGHYVMDTWSLLPDVGGPHGWDARVDPALAWSEGFATFFAQRALSTDTARSRFFSIQSGVAYWVDLAAIGRPPRTDDTSLPLSIPAPDPAAGVTQRLGEAAVAAILWDLWTTHPEAGDEVITAAASPRVRTLDRGAPGPDLVDLLDALSCADPERADLAASLLGFPYDFAPICP